jgi:hypothetical protein
LQQLKVISVSQGKSLEKEGRKRGYCETSVAADTGGIKTVRGNFRTVKTKGRKYESENVGREQ